MLQWEYYRQGHYKIWLRFSIWFQCKTMWTLWESVYSKNDLIYLILSLVLKSQFKHGSQWDLLQANRVPLDACLQADYPEPTEKHENDSCDSLLLSSASFIKTNSSNAALRTQGWLLLSQVTDWHHPCVICISISTSASRPHPNPRSLCEKQEWIQTKKVTMTVLCDRREAKVRGAEWHPGKWWHWV